jgi:RNA recognition motif-containing protein
MTTLYIGNLPFSAMERMNGHELGGRALRVNEARERSASPPRSGGGGRW